MANIVHEAFVQTPFVLPYSTVGANLAVAHDLITFLGEKFCVQAYVLMARKGEMLASVADYCRAMEQFLG